MSYGFNRHRRNNTPPWMVTFADMMALLLTFFILMLSISNTDSAKYKAITDALENSFGPQASQKLEKIIEENKMPPGSPTAAQTDQPQSLQQQLESLLEQEIKMGDLAVEKQGMQTVIRFPERVAFPTASDILRPQFDPVLAKVVSVVEKSVGTIVITGHTDNVPINNDRFRSNWDLSAARAVSVVHAILDRSNIAPTRLVAQGMADTKPISPNDTASHRADNRRVEITILEQPEK